MNAILGSESNYGGSAKIRKDPYPNITPGGYKNKNA